MTDGYSNGGDPRPAAKVLRDQQVEIFTFGIQNGNVKELYDMASDPPEEHSYILDSFEEFEALARRALHEGTEQNGYIKKPFSFLFLVYNLLQVHKLLNVLFTSTSYLPPECARSCGIF